MSDPAPNSTPPPTPSPAPTPSPNQSPAPTPSPNQSPAPAPAGEAKSLSPHVLASQLFESALVQFRGNAHEASMQVMRFLTEALVFTISVAVGDDETARRGLLKSVGDSITAAPRHPLVPVSNAPKGP